MAKERKSLEHNLSLRHPVTLVPEAEGGYTAMIPDLPGCLSVGETPEETLAMIEDARRLWIETAYENGDEIPLPSTERAYSGRLLVRMLRSLHRKLAEGAEREGVSLNQYVVALLQEASALREIRREFAAPRAEIADLKSAVQGTSGRLTPSRAVSTLPSGGASEDVAHASEARKRVWQVS